MVLFCKVDEEDYEMTKIWEARNEKKSLKLGN